MRIFRKPVAPAAPSTGGGTSTPGKAPVILQVHKTAIQSVPNGNSDIVYEKVLRDTASGFDPATSRYTVPATGLYLMSMGISWEYLQNNELFTSFIVRKYVPVLQGGLGRIANQMNGQFSQTATNLVQLTQGDVLWGRVGLDNAPDNRNISGSEGRPGSTFWSLYKVDD